MPELCNHTKHIYSQQENLNNETKKYAGDLQDDIKIIQSVHAKPLVT